MDETDLKTIEEIVGYKFKNKALIRQAFTRSSYAHENSCLDSEMLEFLGDSVIGYYITKLLFSRLTSDEKSGLESNCSPENLTILKSLIVANRNLESRSKLFDFEKHLLIESNEKLQDSYLSDLIESIIGAIAIDSNFNDSVIREAVDFLLEPKAYIYSLGITDYLELRRICKFKKIKFLSASCKQEIDSKTVWKTTINIGKYSATEIADTEIGALFKTATTMVIQIEKNKDGITIEDYLVGLNQHNARHYFDKLGKLKFYKSSEVNVYKIEEKNLWTVTYVMDGYTVSSTNPSKKTAHKICLLLCINNLMRHEGQFCSLIKPLLAIHGV